MPCTRGRPGRYLHHTRLRPPPPALRPTLARPATQNTSERARSTRREGARFVLSGRLPGRTILGVSTGRVRSGRADMQ
eukprot:2153636-Rhodomonas_salina.1